MSSLQETERYSAARSTHPRVSLADIEASITARYDFTAGGALSALNMPAISSTDLLTICILVMKNGFTVVGKSAPASPENFDPEKGRLFAYEDAVRQLWPLMGFALRDRLASQA